MLKVGLISCMLFFSLVIAVLPVKGQENNTNCLSEDTQLGRIGNSLEKGQEKCEMNTNFMVMKH